MKITKLELKKVSIPIEAPLRHSYAVHTVFTRTIVKLYTDEALIGLGETTGNIDENLFKSFESVLIGEDPFNLEVIKMKISQRGYYSRNAHILTPVEIACLDLQGKYTNLPVYKLLGGKIRDKVPTSAYLFYRYPNSEGKGEVTTPEQMAEHALDLVNKYGFKTVKLKGGVFEPNYEGETIAALRKALGPSVKLRFDPNAVWTPETAISVGKKLEIFDLEYYEDPTWGIPGMAEVRKRVALPLATNMCVKEFDEFGPAVKVGAVDIVLSDPWYWGGLTNTKVLARMCSTLGIGIGMHSGLEFGIGLSAMLHLAITIPNLVHAIDAHYHHLLDDIIKGGKIEYKDGCMVPPEGPGLGVSLDEEKVEKYYEFYKSLVNASKRYIPDPVRPEWFAKYPSW